MELLCFINPDANRSSTYSIPTFAERTPSGRQIFLFEAKRCCSTKIYFIVYTNRRSGKLQERPNTAKIEVVADSV
jgi:hypothetical protein